MRHYGIKLYVFDPTAGDFLAGSESHKRHRNVSYETEEYFGTMELLGPVIEAYGLTLRERALRWVAHHSLLDAEKCDAVLMGAIIAARLEGNLADLQKSPLPDKVIGALDREPEREWGRAENTLLESMEI